MKLRILVILSPLVLALSSCSSVELSKEAEKVQVVSSVDANKCKSLGYVVGQGGGKWKGGAWSSNDSLMEYAMNDARNKAAQKGATHMVMSSGPQMNGHSEMGSTGATMSGTIYRCP